jgi:NADPH-dependent curcumin reductase CurA
MKTTILILVVSILALFALATMELHRQDRMRRTLPPVQAATPAEVQLLMVNGADLVAVLGTGSMQPYIPAGEGVVAYCQLERTPYGKLTEGDFVVYATPVGNVCHQLAVLYADGWVASGLHNKRYDTTLGRVTAANYRGRIVRTYILE